MDVLRAELNEGKLIYRNQRVQLEKRTRLLRYQYSLNQVQRDLALDTSSLRFQNESLAPPLAFPKSK